ncbi:MAG: hypothetical protein HYS86_00380 [Candidatus Chisholmbacteria bacterium]|nr:hypothetical protein [Candidatus Chisholmbacteria bacterium]
MSPNAKIFGGIIIFSLVILAGGAWLFSRQSSPEASVPEEQVISRRGLHWHPQLSIYIKGQKQEIPKDIGIGAIHQPIHTHDSSGVLHLEMSGLVTIEKTKMGNFFKVWGKDFSANGVPKMTVNGQENQDFENYLMKDGDKIEIYYDQ